MARIITRKPNWDSSGLPPEMDTLLRRIYAARGIDNSEMLDLGLSKLPSPDSLKGIHKAISRLIEALLSNERIIIIGDFDADGATGTALMLLGLRAMGFRFVDYLVPNRFEFGYGLTPEIVSLALKQKPDLLVTVDNGISSIEGVCSANERSIDVIVTDHHLPGAQLPDACAIVNPNQADCQFPSKNLAGVGVCFFLLIALRTELRERNWFLRESLAEPHLATWLDLVALGTVADLVPLDHVNRILVQQGLIRLRAKKCREGISALLRVSGKQSNHLVAADLGFAIGPRINAAGRLDDISLGIQCLITDDRQDALDLANELDQLNQNRKKIERDMQEEANVLLKKFDFSEISDSSCAICLFHADWHPGVVGLLASRIKDKYQRPVIAFARDDVNRDLSQKKPQLKGSCRSVPALHIRDALEAVSNRRPKLLSRFGGHSMAAGLSLDECNLESFVQEFQAHVSQKLLTKDYEVAFMIDGHLRPDQLVQSTAKLLRDSGPWGQHFPEPSFSDEFIVEQQKVVGKNHLKLVLRHPDGHRYLDAIYFNMDMEKWPNYDSKRFNCVYRLAINEYGGLQKFQLVIEYMESI
ncbi:MAG: single-stranded-DNA-specific exonuclease RecJ [Cellvibrionales bacterium TMED148]|nr:single-stranded-DNA-specific exonuclease RecJ [Porticoccaceae bacterium]RPG88259.1 MAG: single-stranded-DNA-specific exonuclease RecJ [Cellvibrionales bacterium TMED148]